MHPRTRGDRRHQLKRRKRRIFNRIYWHWGAGTDGQKWDEWTEKCFRRRVSANQSDWLDEGLFEPPASHRRRISAVDALMAEGNDAGAPVSPADLEE